MLVLFNNLLTCELMPLNISSNAKSRYFSRNDQELERERNKIIYETTVLHHVHTGNC